MGAIVQRLLFRDNVQDLATDTPVSADLLDISITTIDGDDTTLRELIKGFKLTIIVNVASK